MAHNQIHNEIKAIIAQNGLRDNLRVDFVLDMVDAMCSKYGAELDNSTIVHSDQGSR